MLADASGANTTSVAGKMSDAVDDDELDDDDTDSETSSTATTTTTGGQKQKPSYKHIPHSQKPAHLVAKRNARERRRVQAVNAAFHKLRRCIPIENRNKRVSKVKTLQRAIDYIRTLNRTLEAPPQEAGGNQSLDLQHAAAAAAGAGQSASNERRQRQPRAPRNCDGGHQQTIPAAGGRRGRKPRASAAAAASTEATLPTAPTPPPQRQLDAQLDWRDYNGNGSGGLQQPPPPPIGCHPANDLSVEFVHCHQPQPQQFRNEPYQPAYAHQAHFGSYAPEPQHGGYGGPCHAPFESAAAATAGSVGAAHGQHNWPLFRIEPSGGPPTPTTPTGAKYSALLCAAIEESPTSVSSTSCSSSDKSGSSVCAPRSSRAQQPQQVNTAPGGGGGYLAACAGGHLSSAAAHIGQYAAEQTVGGGGSGPIVAPIARQLAAANCLHADNQAAGENHHLQQQHQHLHFHVPPPTQQVYVGGGHSFELRANGHLSESRPAKLADASAKLAPAQSCQKRAANISMQHSAYAILPQRPRQL